MSCKYVGITIGPILQTLNLSSSPAALWASSYMFSSLSREICVILTKEYGVCHKDIILPYFDEEDTLCSSSDGIGLFHDRVIFAADGLSIDVSEVCDKALHRVAEKYGIDDEKEFAYLKEYVMMAHAAFESDDPVLEGSRILDSLELKKPFVFKETSNPLVSLFENTANEELRHKGRNGAIKEIISGFDKFALRKSDSSLKSISDIVFGEGGFKRNKYYAILRSDGDRMGSIIASLDSNDKRRSFSRTCLQYCRDVADEAVRFGGVPIYSGGDDLLAILPCEGRAGNVFEFIKRANTIFATSFNDYINAMIGKGEAPPTLSFGVTIAYYKFPLYEALEDSAELLFGVAKRSIRNCVAVRVQKHSGQSAGLLISNKKIDFIIEFLSEIERQDEETLLSAMYKLSKFEDAFSGVENEKEIYNLFINTFDSAFHSDNSFVHKRLPAVFSELKAQNETDGVYSIDRNGEVNRKPVTILHYLLRVLKFYIEKKSGEAL